MAIRGGKELYSGLFRYTCFHDAAAEPIYGAWMIGEPRRYGQRSRRSNPRWTPAQHGRNDLSAFG
jgi:hypothetical protein